MDNYTNILNAFKPVADAIFSLLQPWAEVVIHDIETGKIFYIAGNFSNRRSGEPSFIDDISQNSGDQVIGPYRKVNPDGRPLKSVSSLLRDPATGALRGMLCINLDISKFTEFQRVLDSLGFCQSTPGMSGYFEENWQDQISQLVASFLKEHRTECQYLDRRQKKALVHFLHSRGAFKAKNAAAFIAGVIGISRASVYSYLKDSPPS